MKFKNIAQITTLLPLSIYLIYCSYHFLANEMMPKYLDCGNVISKSSDEVTIKHGVRTELYLNIQFNKSGFRSIGCTPTTYFSKKVGENVCFYLNKDVSIWYSINNLIGLVVLIILGVNIVGLFVSYLIPESWYDEW